MSTVVEVSAEHKPPLLCRWGFHKWGKPYEPMDNGYMENCKRRNCDALHEVVTDEGV